MSKKKIHEMSKEEHERDKRYKREWAARNRSRLNAYFKEFLKNPINAEKLRTTNRIKYYMKKYGENWDKAMALNEELEKLLTVPIKS